MKLQAWKNAKFERYIFIILLSVEMLMSFTFLGYIHIPPISATTAFIPIVVAACLFGPWESAVAGLVFGLGSMFKASALYVMPEDKLFSPFQSGFPAGSLVLSLGMRVLFGLVMGLLYHFAKKGRLAGLWKGLLALAAPAVHALFVYGALQLLFPQEGPNYSAAFQINPSDLVLAGLSLVSVLVCDALYRGRFMTDCREAVNGLESGRVWSRRMGGLLTAITVFISCVAVCSTVYFAERARYMLEVHGVAVTEDILHDLYYLQTQFLFSVLAMCLILLLVILILYRAMKYREYRGEMDALTEVMGRRLFLSHCAACQKKKKPGATGWFLFLDVDRFKDINDTLGHAAGDQALICVAGMLRRTFQDCGVVGRVGGDEFAAMVEKELRREELEALLTDFLAQIATALPGQTLGCSIGAYHFAFPREVKDLMARTDEALYRAKESGRGRFVIAEDVK